MPMLKPHPGLNVILSVAPTQTDLEAARKEIARLQQLNQTLLTLFGHALGSPLTLVVAYLRLWQERGAVSAPEELNLVTEQALLLKSRLEDLVLLDQIEAGRCLIAREPLQLYPLLRGMLQKHSTAIQTKRLAVHLDLKCARAVPADAELLSHALDHLVANAIKFSSPGGKISIATCCERDWCKISIQDQGIGIAEQDLDVIFEPFNQHVLSLARRYDGIGIGLKLVRAIVEGHGGAIRVESEVGKGSTFEVRLPMS
jgi:signal transduction histidine kinase